MPTLTLEDILSKTPDLPAIPAVTITVLREVDRNEATAQSIARLITQDQGLSARVLRLSNSAFYGLSRQVMTINEAVMVLGTRTIRSLCLVAGTYPWLTRQLPGYDLGPRKLWEHSFATAVGAQFLCQKQCSGSPEHCFTAGLLHNLGKVAMSAWLDNKLTAMQLLAERDDMTFDECERKVFGFDHAEVGAQLGERWNLPKPMVEVMRFHHNPDAAQNNQQLVDCVHVADYMAAGMSIGLGGDGLRYEISEACLARLGITEEGLNEMYEPFLNETERYMAMFEEKAA